MEKIKVLSIKESKTGSGKTRWSIETSEGWMSCWDSAIVEGLKKLNPNEYVEADIQQKGDFKNIRKVMPTNQDAPVVTEHIQRSSKETTMYASYAKDIFIALLPEARDKPLSNVGIMEEAIALVRQAKGAFE